MRRLGENQGEPLTIRDLIHTAFTQQELDILRRDPRFLDASARAQTVDDFEALCQTAESLFSEVDPCRPTYDDRPRTP